MDRTYSMKLKTLAEEVNYEIVHKSSDYDTIDISNANMNRPSLQLAGFYDYFDPGRIQIMGNTENAYLATCTPEERLNKIEQLMKQKIPALIVCNDVDVPAEALEMAEKYDITIFKTKSDTSELLFRSLSQLQEHLAPRVTRHGVFVEVYGEGLLLMGESGIGKSEAAIELIKRGHRLIADDAVEIRNMGSHRLMGRAPDLIKYYIELRGIGIIDVRRIFGIGAVKTTEYIDMVINIEAWQEGMTYNRLGVEEEFTDILGVKLPCITIPVKPGRNLAVILEVAAMNNRQKKMGYNSAQEFTDQINKYFEQQGFPD